MAITALQEAFVADRHKDAAQIKARLPRSHWTILRRRGGENHRSGNAEIQIAVEEYLEKHGEIKPRKKGDNSVN